MPTSRSVAAYDADLPLRYPVRRDWTPCLFPGRGLGVHVETAGWIYQWDRYGFDRTQLDLTIGGGLSYRFRSR